MLVMRCQYDPFAHEFTHVKPSASEMVGSYVLDRQSAEMLARVYRVSAPRATLVLSNDGTFVVTQAPTC